MGNFKEGLREYKKHIFKNDFNLVQDIVSITFNGGIVDIGKCYLSK
jgi:hypothetical protein